MSVVRDSLFAANWMGEFFPRCKVESFSGANVPIDTICSVIGFPYGEKWRVRMAWLHSGKISVHVSHCPTGDVTLNTMVEDFNDARLDISNAVKGEDY
jgi:hypothetical protein